MDTQLWMFQEPNLTGAGPVPQQIHRLGVTSDKSHSNLIQKCTTVAGFSVTAGPETNLLVQNLRPVLEQSGLCWPKSYMLYCLGI